MPAGKSKTGVPNPWDVGQYIQWPVKSQVEGEPGKLPLSYRLSSASYHPSPDGGKIVFPELVPGAKKVGDH